MFSQTRALVRMLISIHLKDSFFSFKKTKLTKKSGVTILRGTTLDILYCWGGENSCGTNSGNGESYEFCCCTGDLCNGASMLLQQPLTIFFLTMTTLVMFIYRHF